MGAAAVSVLPPSVDGMRLDVVERFACLLENQVRNQQLSQTMHDTAMAVVSEVLADLRKMLDVLSGMDLPPGQRERLLADWESALKRCDNLRAAVRLLDGLRSQRSQASRNDFRSILLRFDDTAQKLAGTLVQKELLERQSMVLEQIILSHEKVSQWKVFAKDILASFQEVFPFQFFFIAFGEPHGLSLNLYYSGNPGEEVKRLARNNLARRMIKELQLPEDAPLDFEEFELPGSLDADGARDMDMIMVSVPEIENLNLAGLLGVAYASSHKPSVQEETIIRSILAVMVMVVGSSKALGRTLSELEYYSSHDPLTGLNNRRYFSEMLEYEVGRSSRHGHEFSLLMLDLDDFKDVNDTWGHPCGDMVLRRIAESLNAETRKGDLAARLGGDEFILLLTETGREGAHAVAEKLRRRLKESVYQSPDGQLFHVTTSIGLITFPADADSVSDLMSGVDMGLYRAKALGKDGVAVSESVGEQLAHNRKNRDFLERIRVALQEERMVPFFQPIIDSRTGQLFAYETLARMKEPSGETVSAGVFIETIERYGLGRELDMMVVKQALRVLRDRLEQGLPMVKLFINLSAQELEGRGVIAYAEQLCAQWGIAPSMLVFEILERDAIGDMSHTRTFLSMLRQKGFLFALDDFGSGYNSFHYLRELSFDFVKIDGSFVRNILNSKIDHSLVRNLTNLCRDLGIRVVAEFVESAALWEALREMGVDYAQGYHLGMPSPQMP